MKHALTVLALVGCLGLSAEVLASRSITAQLSEQNDAALTYKVSDDAGVLATVFVRRSDGRVMVRANRGVYADKGHYLFPDLDTALDWVTKEVR